MFKSLFKHFQVPLVLPPYPSHMSGPDYLLSLIFCPLQLCSLSSSHISVFQPLARTWSSSFSPCGFLPLCLSPTPRCMGASPWFGTRSSLLLFIWRPLTYSSSLTLPHPNQIRDPSSALQLLCGYSANSYVSYELQSSPFWSLFCSRL